MITTKEVDVKLGIGRNRFRRVTTKTIDASIKVEKPKVKPKKSPLVSTHNTSDAAEERERSIG